MYLDLWAMTSKSFKLLLSYIEEFMESEVQKIIIADRNRLLREMLTKAINADEHLKIVHILTSLDDLSEHVESDKADWVILSYAWGNESLPPEVNEMMISFPDVGVMQVSPDGSQVRLRWLEERKRVLDGISLDKFIQLLSTKPNTE